jgi:hypothetical protein
MVTSTAILDERTVQRSLQPPPIYRALGLPFCPFRAGALEIESQLQALLSLTACKNAPVVISHGWQDVSFAAYLVAIAVRRLKREGRMVVVEGLIRNTPEAPRPRAELSLLWGAERFESLEQWLRVDRRTILITGQEFRPSDLRISLRVGSPVDSHIGELARVLQDGPDGARAGLLCCAAGYDLPVEFFSGGLALPFVEILDHRTDRPTEWVQAAGGYAIARKAVRNFYGQRRLRLRSDLRLAAEYVRSRERVSRAAAALLRVLLFGLDTDGFPFLE